MRTLYAAVFAAVLSALPAVPAAPWSLVPSARAETPEPQVFRDGWLVFAKSFGGLFLARRTDFDKLEKGEVDSIPLFTFTNKRLDAGIASFDAELSEWELYPLSPDDTEKILYDAFERETGKGVFTVMQRCDISPIISCHNFGQIIHPYGGKIVVHIRTETVADEEVPAPPPGCLAGQEIRSLILPDVLWRTKDPNSTVGLEGPPFNSCRPAIWHYLTKHPPEGELAFNKLTLPKKFERFKKTEAEFSAVDGKLEEIEAQLETILTQTDKFLEDEQAEKMTPAEVIALVDQLLAQAGIKVKNYAENPEQPVVGGQLYEDLMKLVKELAELDIVARHGKDPVPSGARPSITVLGDSWRFFTQSTRASKMGAMDYIDWKQKDAVSDVHEKAMRFLLEVNAKFIERATSMLKLTEPLDYAGLVAAYKKALAGHAAVVEEIDPGELSGESAPPQPAPFQLDQLTRLTNQKITNQLLHEAYTGMLKRQGINESVYPYAAWEKAEGAKLRGDLQAGLGEFVKVDKGGEDYLEYRVKGDDGPGLIIKSVPLSVVEGRDYAALAEGWSKDLLADNRLKGKAKALLAAALEGQEKAHESFAASVAGLPFEPYTQKELGEKGAAIRGEEAAKRRQAMMAAREKCGPEPVDNEETDARRAEYRNCLQPTIDANRENEAASLARADVNRAQYLGHYADALEPKAAGIRRRWLRDIQGLRRALGGESASLTGKDIHEYFNTHWIKTSPDFPASVEAYKKQHDKDYGHWYSGVTRIFSDPMADFETYVGNDFSKWYADRRRAEED